MGGGGIWQCRGPEGTACAWAPLKDAYKSRFLVLPEVPVPVRPRFPIESADAPGEPEGVPPGAGAEGTPAAMQVLRVGGSAEMVEVCQGGLGPGG